MHQIVSEADINIPRAMVRAMTIEMVVESLHPKSLSIRVLTLKVPNPPLT